jgi:hypothetical protein
MVRKLKKFGKHCRTRTTSYRYIADKEKSKKRRFNEKKIILV